MSNITTEAGDLLITEDGRELVTEDEGGAETPVFQIGVVPIKAAADPLVAGVVPVYVTARDVGVVPVNTVPSFIAGVVPVRFMGSPGVGVVPVYEV